MSNLVNLVKFLEDQEPPVEIEYLSRASNFTVLISTYIKDDVKDFELAVKSIFYNTVVPNEILITVDGPVTNEMNQLLEYFTKLLPNVVRILRQKINQGRGNIAAFGVESARYELIAKMDSDDIAILQRFEKQLSLMLNNNVDVLGGQISEFDESFEIISRRVVPVTQEEIVDFSRMRSPINQPTVMFRRSSVLKVGNYTNLNVLEDYDLWMRMIANKMIFQNVDEDLVYMRAFRQMYQRRGGIQYFKQYASFRKGLLRRKFISYWDYYKSMIGMLVVSLIPTVVRKKIYVIFLRNSRIR